MATTARFTLTTERIGGVPFAKCQRRHQATVGRPTDWSRRLPLDSNSNAAEGSMAKAGIRFCLF